MNLIAISAAALLLCMMARGAIAFGVPPLRFAVGSSSHKAPLYMTQSSDSSFTSATSASDDAPQAHDGEALQILFHKQCDKDGLMTKSMLQSIPAIQELLVCSV